ncbi:MAG: CBS domain-containing membrane protein [Planctomycetota bacterium]|jgi:CBS domain-containing membrane protein
MAGLSGALVLLVGLMAWLAGAPCLAPPLGVTAYLLARDPRADSSSPRSILLGHAIGLAAGLGSASLFHVLGEPGALTGTFAMGHALGSALAIALTVGLTEGLRCSHPPAGATTLVASLGLLSLEGGVLAFMIGASVLAGCSLALRQKRLRG